VPALHEGKKLATNYAYSIIGGGPQVIATVIRVIVLRNQPKLPIHIAFLLILI
jgi:hypothetical protein